MRTNTIRLLTAVTVAALPAVALGSTAHAGGATQDQDIRTAYVQWVGTGGVPGLPGGTVHRAVVTASDDVLTPGVDSASGRLEAWTCPAGVTPPDLFTAGDPDAPPTPCVFEGARDLEFTSATLVVGRGLAKARLTGSAHAVDATGGPAADTLPVDVTWTATGPVVSDSDRFQWVDEAGRHWIRTTVAARDARATGTVGAESLEGAQWQLSVLQSQVDRLSLR